MGSQASSAQAVKARIHVTQTDAASSTGKDDAMYGYFFVNGRKYRVRALVRGKDGKVNKEMTTQAVADKVAKLAKGMLEKNTAILPQNGQKLHISKKLDHKTPSNIYIEDGKNTLKLNVNNHTIINKNMEKIAGAILSPPSGSGAPSSSSASDSASSSDSDSSASGSDGAHHHRPPFRRRRIVRSDKQQQERPIAHRRSRTASSDVIAAGGSDRNLPQANLQVAQNAARLAHVHYGQKGFDTKQAALKAIYEENETLIAADPSIQPQQKQTQRVDNPQKVDKNGRTTYTTTYDVSSDDTLTAAKNLIAADSKSTPVVLNFADRNGVGGKYENGGTAQEESLCHLTNLFKVLCTVCNVKRKNVSDGKGGSQWKTFYGNKPNDQNSIPEKGCLYSPNVTILRDNQYKWLETKFRQTIAVISSAAYDIHQGRSGQKDGPDRARFQQQQQQQYEDAVKDKMRAQLRTAANQGHKDIVLGAWGCGVFGNDPKTIAKFYHDVLNEDEFKGVFNKVVFAMGTTNQNNPNLKAFQGQFPRPQQRRRG